jgi:hypothetical protein
MLPSCVNIPAGPETLVTPTEQSLRDAFVFVGGRRLPIGQSSAVAVAISPDNYNKGLVTGNAEKHSASVAPSDGRFN